MFQAIATETEITRAALNGKSGWNSPVPQQARGFVPESKRQRQLATTVADLLPWPALLTLDDCAGKAAKRAGCTKQEILEFALTICPIEHIVTVLNFMATDQGIADAAKMLSPLIRGLKAKEARIKQGASVGGKKSARKRQSIAKNPGIARLLQERQGLLDSGEEIRVVASKLAKRHGVHPSTIRRLLKVGRAQKEKK
jgi:hypothetical protein